MNSVISNQYFWHADGHRLQKLYSYFSCSLSFTVLVFIALHAESSILNAESLNFGILPAIAYTIISVLFLISSHLKRIRTLAVNFAFVEIFILHLICVNNVGLHAMINSIMVVPIIFVNFLLPGRYGYAVAAWACIGHFIEVSYSTDSQSSTAWFSAGITGSIYFLLATVVNVFARKLDSTLDQSTERFEKIKVLKEINNQTLNQSPAAIVAIYDDELIFCNTPAREWFDIDTNQKSLHLLRNLSDDKIFKYNGNEYFIQTKTISAQDSSSTEYPHIKFGQGLLIVISDIALLIKQQRNTQQKILDEMSFNLTNELVGQVSNIHQSLQLISETSLSIPQKNLVACIDDANRQIDTLIASLSQLHRPSIISDINIISVLEDISQQIECPYRLDIEDKLKELNSTETCFDYEHLEYVLNCLLLNLTGVNQSRQFARICLKLNHDGTLLVSCEDLITGGSPVIFNQEMEPPELKEPIQTNTQLLVCKAVCEIYGASFSITMRSESDSENNSSSQIVKILSIKLKSCTTDKTNNYEVEADMNTVF